MKIPWGKNTPKDRGIKIIHCIVYGARNQDFQFVLELKNKQTTTQKKNQQTNKTKTALNSSVTSLEIQRYVGSFTPWHIKNENQWCEGNWKDRMT